VATEYDKSKTGSSFAIARTRGIDLNFIIPTINMLRNETLGIKEEVKEEIEKPDNSAEVALLEQEIEFANENLEALYDAFYGKSILVGCN